MSSPEDDELRAIFDQAHGPTPPFRALLAQARPAARHPVILVALPALALALALCVTFIRRPPAPVPTPMSEIELARLGELGGPLDFLLEPAACHGLEGLPSFDLSPLNPQPIELTKGLRP